VFRNTLSFLSCFLFFLLSSLVIHKRICGCSLLYIPCFFFFAGRDGLLNRVGGVYINRTGWDERIELRNVTFIPRHYGRIVQYNYGLTDKPQAFLLW